MLAARAHQGETDLRLEEVDRPTAGPGEVLIKVASAGMAPGVLALWQLGRYPILPRTLGNEAAGWIEEVGAGVTEFAAGDRVRLHPNLSCGACEYCLTDREQMCRRIPCWARASSAPTPCPCTSATSTGRWPSTCSRPPRLVDPLPEAISFDVAAKVHDIADAVRAWPQPPCREGPPCSPPPPGRSARRRSAWRGSSAIGRVIAVARSAERLDQVRALAPDLVDTVALEDIDFEQNGGLTGAIRRLVPAGPDAVIDFLPEGPGDLAGDRLAQGRRHRGADGRNMAMPPLPTIAIMVNCWRIVGTRGCTREDARQAMRWLAERDAAARRPDHPSLRPRGRLPPRSPCATGPSRPGWSSSTHDPESQESKDMETLYIGYGDGLVRATVNGRAEAEWVLRGAPVAQVAADPLEPERVYAATLGAGLWRSEDGGRGFEQLAGIPNDLVWSVAVSASDRPGGHGAVYAGTQLSALYRSTDGGETFDELSPSRNPVDPGVELPPGARHPPRAPDHAQHGGPRRRRLRSRAGGRVLLRRPRGDMDAHVGRPGPAHPAHAPDRVGAHVRGRRGRAVRTPTAARPGGAAASTASPTRSLLLRPRCRHGDADTVLISAARDPFSGHAVIPDIPVWSAVYRSVEGPGQVVTRASSARGYGDGHARGRGPGVSTT